MVEEAASRGAGISTLLFIVGEVILLAVTQAVGGSPWTLVAMAALIPLGFLRPDVVTIALAATCLAWPWLGPGLAGGNAGHWQP